MVSIARHLARVAISSASIFEWVPYDFEQIISLQVSMSTCVGLPFFSIGCNVTLSCFQRWLSLLVSCLSIMADCFSFATFGCFSLSFFLMSEVMSCFPLMSLAWFTILTLWHPAAFGDFWKKKRLNTRGFAREFLWPGMLYRPSKRLKRCGKSSSLHSKMTPKLLHLRRQSQKIRTPSQEKIFSSAIYWTGWSVKALEQLSSTIGGGAKALVRQPKTIFRPKLKYEYRVVMAEVLEACVLLLTPIFYCC